MFVLFFVILFGLRAYTVMVTYHWWVPRSSRCSYSVFFCKWELFNDIRHLNGYFEAHMPILSRPVLISVINNQAELLVLWLPIIGEYLVYLGALIRSFYKNGSHLNPQNGPKWPKMVIFCLKMVQKWSKMFFSNFFVRGTRKAMWKTRNVLFKVRIAAFPAYLWQRIDQNGHNKARKAIFIVFVLFSVSFFGSELIPSL